MAEVEINGIRYFTTRLGGFDQWHIARKLMPYMVSTGPLSRIGDETGPNGPINPEQLDRALKPLASALAEMSYADWNFVINICLGVVRRQDPNGNLRPVIQLNGPPEQKGTLIFENEMNWPILIKLTMEVCNADVLPFYGDGLSSLVGMGTTPPNGAAGEPIPAISGSPMA